MVLVFEHARARNRFGAGRQPGVGGPLYLRPVDRIIYCHRMGPSRIAIALAGAGGGHGDSVVPRDDRAATRVLEEQHHALGACGRGHYRKFPSARSFGRTSRQSGKSDQAITHYNEALRLNPDSEEAHNKLANALAGQGKFAEAAAHYVAALRIHPDYADAHNGLGFVLESQGRIAEAIAQYASALRIDPNYG